MDGQLGNTAPSTPVEAAEQGSTWKGKRTGGGRPSFDWLLKSYTRLNNPLAVVKPGMNNEADKFLVRLFLEQTISLHCCKSITGGS